MIFQTLPLNDPLFLLFGYEDPLIRHHSKFHSAGSKWARVCLLDARLFITKKWKCLYAPTITDVRATIQYVYLNERLNAEKTLHSLSIGFISKWWCYIKQTLTKRKQNQALYTFHSLYGSKQSTKQANKELTLIQANVTQCMVTATGPVCRI